MVIYWTCGPRYSYHCLVYYVLLVEGAQIFQWRVNVAPHELAPSDSFWRRSPCRPESTYLSLSLCLFSAFLWSARFAARKIRDFRAFLRARSIFNGFRFSTFTRYFSSRESQIETRRRIRSRNRDPSADGYNTPAFQPRAKRAALIAESDISKLPVKCYLIKYRIQR